MQPLIALITLLTVLLLAGCAAYVGRARGRYGVKAPAVTGPEGFERALRVQANTNEAALMFLPALWVASYVHVSGISAALGALWLVARIWYAFAYANPARSRGPAFVLSLVALVMLVLQAAWGLFWVLVVF